MIMSTRSLLPALFAALMSLSSLQAESRLAGIFTDNMVLQRDMAVPVWGWADPGEEVTVTFAGQSKTAKADTSGKWMVRLDKLDASKEGRVLKAGKQECKNVVVGEVWLCSGQSNMEWKLSGTKNGNTFIAAADFPDIRLVTTPREALMKPRKDLDLKWLACSPSTVPGFSAVGYHFGRSLYEKLDVPIGLINSSWGGTKIEPWTPPEGFARVKALKEISDKLAAEQVGSPKQLESAKATIKKVEAWLEEANTAVDEKKALPQLPDIPSLKVSHQDPTRIYNAKIYPLVPYALRGAIWYQGESNRKETEEEYYNKKIALVEGWREIWGYDLSFYWVQLSSWKAANPDPEGGDGWAPIWNAQRRALSLPKTGMASAVDIPDYNDINNIHPRNKQDVGARLALWALAKDYGFKDVVCSGPLYKSHQVKDGKVILEFDYVGSGLMVGKKDGTEPTVEDKDAKLKRFAIAGKDKKWYWADAEIVGDTIVVSCDKVPEPVAVRYAFSQNPEGLNLYNREGLPASPFRTDDWDITFHEM
jgi:sialate O-acetylesterase